MSDLTTPNSVNAPSLSRTFGNIDLSQMRPDPATEQLSDLSDHAFTEFCRRYIELQSDSSNENLLLSSMSVQRILRQFYAKLDDPSEKDKEYFLANANLQFDESEIVTLGKSTLNLILAKKFLLVPVEKFDAPLDAKILKNVYPPIRCLYYMKRWQFVKQQGLEKDAAALLFFLCYEIQQSFLFTQFLTEKDRISASWNMFFDFFSVDILSLLQNLIQSKKSFMTFIEFLGVSTVKEVKEIYPSQDIGQGLLSFQSRLEECQARYPDQDTLTKFGISGALCFFNVPLEKLLIPKQENNPENLKKYLINPSTCSLGDSLRLWAKTFTEIDDATTEKNESFFTIRRNLLISKTFDNDLSESIDRDFISLIMNPDFLFSEKEYICLTLGTFNSNPLFDKAITDFICFANDHVISKEKNLELINELLLKPNCDQQADELWSLLRELEPTRFKGYANHFRCAYEVEYLSLKLKDPLFPHQLNQRLEQIKDDKNFQSFLPTILHQIAVRITEQTPSFNFKNMISTIVDAASEYQCHKTLNLMKDFHIATEVKNILSKSDDPSFPQLLQSNLTKLSDDQEFKTILYKLTDEILKRDQLHKLSIFTTLIDAATKNDCVQTHLLLKNRPFSHEEELLFSQCYDPSFTQQLRSCLDLLNDSKPQIHQFLINLTSHIKNNKSASQTKECLNLIMTLLEAAKKYQCDGAILTLALWLKEELFFYDGVLKALNEKAYSWHEFYNCFTDMIKNYLFSLPFRTYFDKQLVMKNYVYGLWGQLSILIDSTNNLPPFLNKDEYKLALEHLSLIFEYAFEPEAPPIQKDFELLPFDNKIAHHALLIEIANQNNNFALAQEHTLLLLFELYQNNHEEKYLLWMSPLISVAKPDFIKYLGIQWDKDQKTIVPKLESPSIDQYPSIKRLCQLKIYETQEIQDFLQKMVETTTTIQSQLDRFANSSKVKKNAFLSLFYTVFSKNPLFINPLDQKNAPLYAKIPVKQDPSLLSFLGSLKVPGILTEAGVLRMPFFAQDEPLTLDVINIYQKEQQRLDILPQKFEAWLNSFQPTSVNAILTRYLLMQDFSDSPKVVFKNFVDVYSQLISSSKVPLKLPDTPHIMEQATKLMKNVLTLHWDPESKEFKQYEIATQVAIIEACKDLFHSASSEEFNNWLIQIKHIFSDHSIIEGVTYGLFDLVYWIEASSAEDKAKLLFPLLEQGLSTCPLKQRELKFVFIAVLKATSNNEQVHARYYRAYHYIIAFLSNEQQSTIEACLKMGDLMKLGIKGPQKQLSDLQQSIRSSQNQMSRLTEQLQEQELFSQLTTQQQKLTAQKATLESRLKAEEEQVKEQISMLKTQIKEIQSQQRHIKPVKTLQEEEKCEKQKQERLLEKIQQLSKRCETQFSQIDSQRKRLYTTFSEQKANFSECPISHGPIKTPALLTQKALEQVNVHGLDGVCDLDSLQTFLLGKGWSPQDICDGLITLEKSERGVFLESDAVKASWNGSLKSILQSTRALLAHCQPQAYSSDVTGRFQTLQDYFSKDPVKNIFHMLEYSFPANFQGTILITSLMNEMVLFVESSIKIALLALGEPHLHNKQLSFRDSHQIVAMMKHIVQSLKTGNYQSQFEELDKSGWNRYRTEYEKGVRDQANISVMLRDLSTIFAAKIPPIGRDEIKTKILAAQQIIASFESLMSTWETICEEVVTHLQP